MTTDHAVPNSERSYGDGDFSFQTAGGVEGIRTLVDAFYDAMETLPEAAVIRAMHKADLAGSRHKLALFLCGWLGGPRLYREQYGPIVIPSAHRHLDIGVAERDAWLLCMQTALAQQPYPQDFKTYLLAQLYRPAEMSRTR
jgi:hemoglobin